MYLWSKALGEHDFLRCLWLWVFFPNLQRMQDCPQIRRQHLTNQRRQMSHDQSLYRSPGGGCSALSNLSCGSGIGHCLWYSVYSYRCCTPLVAGLPRQGLIFTWAISLQYRSGYLSFAGRCFFFLFNVVLLLG